MDAMFGSKLWKRLRILEFGLVSIVYRSVMVWCSCCGGRFLCVVIPLIACRLVLLKLRTKSGMARALGSQHPNPPLVTSSCAICSECGGNVSILNKICRKFMMMLFMAVVRGPFH